MPSLVFGYDSALSVYRRAGERALNCPRQTISLSDATCSLGAAGHERLVSWVVGDGRAHLVVPSPTAHVHTRLAESHVCSDPAATWPVLRLADSVFVSTPEWLFLQMAYALSRLETTFLGCELCGSYGMVDGTLPERTALTTVASIDAFLRERPGARGRKKAFAALPWVVEGARSPMEVALVLRLCLSRRVGGYGLPTPRLNEAIRLGPNAARIMRRPEMRPDLSWREHHVALEYDSDAEHTGAQRIARDARRRLALEEEGYRVITVTNEHMTDARSFDALARALERALGMRNRDWTENGLRKRFELARDLARIATSPMALTLSGRGGEVPRAA